MNIWHEYLEVMTNPGHFLAEATFTLGEFIVFQIIWQRGKKIIKRWISDEHRKIDAEHHINHPNPPESQSRAKPHWRLPS